MFLNWSQDKFQTTIVYAANAHQGQTMPGSDLPYLLHINLVTMEVLACLAVENQHDANLAMQCALLHDVVEDTKISLAEIRARFGSEVAAGVSALTKNPDLPKDQVMGDSLVRIRQQPSAVWVVKLADRISNLRQPPFYWTLEKKIAYRDEAHQIYHALSAGSPFLAQRLEQKIEEYQRFLEE